jgi:hypothetical protein
MSSIARSARELNRKSLEIKRLQQQARAHQMNLESAMKTICVLTDQLSDSFRAKTEIDPITSPADCIFHDRLQNRQREISGRRYSRETMMWARQVYDISPNAWEAVRKVLPFPSARVLNSAFRETRAAVSHGLLDVNEIDSKSGILAIVNKQMSRKN